jgi:hypothetical protein
MRLFFDLAPPDQGQVANNLINDIIYYNNTHLTTGNVGLRFLMRRSR